MPQDNYKWRSLSAMIILVAVFLSACSKTEAPKQEAPAEASYDDRYPTLPAFKRIQTPAEFVETYPERAERLFASLNLDHPGFMGVKGHYLSGDLAAAAQSLADYYRRTEHGKWLKQRVYMHDPGGFTEVGIMAPAALKDEFTFQSITGIAQRMDNGRINWAFRGPKDDFQWAIFLNRHFQMIPMLKSYYETGDKAYAAKVDEIVQDWVSSNYPAEEGPNDKALRAAWKPMSSASRFLQAWPQVFYGMQNDSSFSDAGRLMMLSSVPEQAEHLIRYHRRKHNHAVKEMIGLAHAAAAWPEFKDAAEWRDYSLKILGEELDFQVYPSGVQKELAAHYHRTVSEYFMQYVAFMRAADFKLPDVFEKRIEEMGQYFAVAMRPNGTIPLNNDSDLDNVRGQVLKLAEIFERPDWRYIATHGEEGSQPSYGSSHFHPYAGQLISREDWSADAAWVYFNIGPYGISHQHRDKLHVSLSDGGRDFLVDTGRYIYKRGDPHREYLVGSSSHNVILVDGQGQNPQQVLENETPMTEVAVIRPSFDLAFGSFTDGFENVDGKALHHRATLYLKALDAWLVVDEVETDRPRQLRSLWHFHPDVGLKLEQTTAFSDDADTTNVRLQAIGDNPWQTRIARGEDDPVLGWYSPFYNTRLPAPVAVFDMEVQSSSAFAWLIHTDEGAATQRLSAELLPAPEGAVRVKLQGEGGIDSELAFRLRGDGPIPLSDSRELHGAFAMVSADGAMEVVGEIKDAEGNMLASGEWTH